MRDREPTMRSRELGEGLRRAMERAGLNGKQAAHLLGWSPSWVSRLLSGKRGGSEVDVAAFLGVCRLKGPERDRLLALCAEFEAEFHRALAQADKDFDTSRVDALIGRWWARAIVLLNPDPDADAAWERIKVGDTSELVEQWRPQPDGSQHVYRKTADGWAFSHVQSAG